MTRVRAGFSLVELLVGLAILGILMSVLTAMLFDTQRVTSRQSMLIDAGQSSRLALLRLSEVVTQAAYIYPAGVTLDLTGAGLLGVGTASIPTGSRHLAVLVPRGSTYCPGGGNTYCGFVYAVAPRAPFVSLLGPAAATEFVLVELRASGVSWPQGTLPPTSWTGVTSGILADSVDRDATDMGSAARLVPAQRQGGFDQNAGFVLGSVDATRSLVQAVSPRIVVRVGGASSGTVDRETSVQARSAPRNALPNPN